MHFDISLKKNKHIAQSSEYISMNVTEFKNKPDHHKSCLTLVSGTHKVTFKKFEKKGKLQQGDKDIDKDQGEHWFYLLSLYII